MIKVIIAEDHQAFVDGVRAFLDNDSNIEIIGTANNGMSLVSLVQQCEADVVITDLRMPDMDGLTAIREIRKFNSDVKIIALTMFDQLETVERVTKSGAQGYLLKNSGLTALKEAISSVYEGKYYFDSKLREAIGDSEVPNVELTRLSKLSDREKQILSFIAKGMSSVDIAAELYISKSTVNTHRKNMCKKLGVSGSHGLFEFAIYHKF